MWSTVRRAVTFLLGVAIIVDAVLSTHNPLGEYVVGTVLIGLVNAHELLAALVDRRSCKGDQ